MTPTHHATDPVTFPRPRRSEADVTFSASLWDDAIAGTYAAILRQPFLNELTAGTLDRGSFEHYVVEDGRYLSDYARALSVCAARAPTDPDIATFARHAAGAIEVERELHAGLLDDLGIDPGVVAAGEPAPTTRAYASYLLATTHQGSFADALGAVLPCYWVYAEVGNELVARGSSDARYQRWIDTYAGDEFQALVREVLAIVDRVGEGLSPYGRASMTHHTAIAARYEWMFWDAAYRRERWPV